jgi:hypothetical protein
VVPFSPCHFLDFIQLDDGRWSCRVDVGRAEPADYVGRTPRLAARRARLGLGHRLTF